MHMEVRVPTLGESMTEATVGRWFKSVGEAVAQDEALLELETDKVTVEVPAPVSGTLLEIAAESGATVEIGALLARVAEGAGAIGGEAKPDPPVAAAETPGAETPAASPPPAAEADPPPSPAARKLIDEHGLDAARIPGTGKDGRIVKGDVLATVAAAAPAAAAPAVAERTPGEREERVRMTRLRQRIAERLKEAQNTAAILTTYNEADMSAVMALRAGLRDEFEHKHGVKLGFMSFFVKACVAALQEIPAVNAEIVGDEIVYKNHYDIGVAVGTGRDWWCRWSATPMRWASPSWKRPSPTSARAPATASCRSRSCRAAPSASPTVVSTAR